MTCEQAELRMGELLAGEISPAGRSELEQHLLDCADCREDFRLAREGYRIEWAEVPVPHDVIQGTLAALREPPALVRVFRWGTAAAAIISVAVLLISSSRSTPVVPPPAEPLAAACTTPREPVLASVQDAVVGALVCKDEDGRPVGELGLKSHEVSVEILDGIAKTTVEENFENHTDRRLEGSFNFPLPSDASISRLALEVNGKIEEGTCLERERARQVFESIVRKMQDPALLEWQPGGFFKCRVFPIEPRATKRVIVAYTQTLPCFQGKMSYVYPLASEKTRTHPPGEVRIHVTARFTGALTRIESTSHHLDVQRKDAHEASMSFRAANYRPNNDFVVTLEPQEEEVRVVCHKPDAEPGYFACFATPKSTEPRAPQKHTFVLDASASISAPRLEVAKRLVRAMMERAIPGDRFEVLAHSVEVESSGEVDLRAANTFMDRLQPIGGSDVLKALKAAGPGEIVYIGKGTPTFGETQTAAILEAMKGARIRTVAVGSDANLPLLEKLGGMMRIAPNDEVDKRVGEIAATLGSPVISELKVEGDNISDVVGVRDLFAGERLIVVGRYKAAGASKVVLSGRGYRREVEVAFPEKEEANNSARRLWAQRKVADLLAKGESTKPEVTALGVKYQIMTPYTSFLVLENEQMWKDHQLQREVQKQDKVLGKATTSADERLKTEVTRKVAHHLELAYMAAEQKKYDRTIKLCDEILSIDPDYPVAKSLRDEMEKSRHKEQYFSVLTGKLEALKRQTDDDETPKIPEQAALKIPSPERWAEVSKRLTEAVIRTEGGVAPEEERNKLRVQTAADPLPRTVNPPSGQVGPGFSSQETARRESWDVRRNEFHTGGKGSSSELRSEILRLPVIEENKARDDYRRLLWEQTVIGGSPTLPGAPITDALPTTVEGLEFPDMQTGKDLFAKRRAREGGATFGEDPDRLAIQRKLDTMKVDLSFENSKLEDILGFVRDFSGLNLILDAGVRDRIDSDKPVTLNVRDLPVKDTLTQLLTPLGLDYVVTDDNVVLLTDPNKAPRELVSKRRPKGIQAMTEDTSEEDQTIKNKLQDIRMNFDMENAPLTAVVDYIRQVSGLNIHISGIDNPDSEQMTLKGQDVPLDAALRLLLNPRSKDYRVRDGVILISTQEKLRRGDAVNSRRPEFSCVTAMESWKGDGRKILNAKVTAVAPESRSVVISVGSEDGVRVGDEFVILRGEEVIARIWIDRVDRKSSTGSYGGVPKVGDDVTNKMLCNTSELDRQSLDSLKRIRAKMGIR